MNKYILIGLIVYLFFAGGCVSNHEWVEDKSGYAARQQYLKRKHYTLPTEQQSWHMLYMGQITKKEYYEHRELRRQKEYSLLEGSYGKPLPERVQHDTFGSFLFHSLIGTADGKVK